MLRLNLGSGQNRLEGWVNVDKAGAAKPDVQLDLEHGGWPWKDETVDEVRMVHVLEHLGQTIDAYATIWKELYRVMKPGGRVYIAVPHPRHENFIGDPTHVRPVTAQQLTLLSRKNCQRWAKQGAANTPLALYWGVDFEIEGAVNMIPDAKWQTLRPDPSQRTPQQLALDAELFGGVCAEIQCQLVRV